MAASRKTPTKLGAALAFEFSIVILLSGCASLPHESAPPTLVDPARLNLGNAAAQAPAASWPVTDWWHQFRDPQLDQLVEQALQHSPTLREAQARVAASMAVAKGAQGATLPEISLDASPMRERFTAMQFIPPPWGGSTYWNNTAQISLTYDLDLWGKQESLWHASLDEAKAASLQQREVRLELETAIVRNYVQLALAERLLGIARKRLDQSEQRNAIAERAHEAGIGTVKSVGESEMPLPLLRAQVDDLRARTSLLRFQIAALSGQDPAYGERIHTPLLRLETSAGLPSRLPAELIARRPDVVAQRWLVEAASNREQSAHAAFYPNINLLSFVGFQAIGFSQLFSSAAAMAGAGPALSLPLFDGGQREARLEGAQALRQQAVERYNQTVLQALQQVSTQLALIQSYDFQQGEIKKSLHRARDLLTMAEESYKEGLSSYGDVLDTQGTVLGLEAQLAQSEASGQDAYVGLMLALGGGYLGEGKGTQP